VTAWLIHGIQQHAAAASEAASASETAQGAVAASATANLEIKATMNGYDAVH